VNVRVKKLSKKSEITSRMAEIRLHRENSSQTKDHSLTDFHSLGIDNAEQKE
jgi:hypothetical protein